MNGLHANSQAILLYTSGGLAYDAGEGSRRGANREGGMATTKSARASKTQSRTAKAGGEQKAKRTQAPEPRAGVVAPASPSCG